MKTCTFVTGNPNKVIEVNAILGDKIAIKPLALDIPEIQGTLEEIAADKCRRASKIVDGPVIVEDSALEFNAMNKLPGPYIKYFLESLGNEGLNKLLYSHTDKTAEAVCTFAFTTGPTIDPIVFQGRLKVCLSSLYRNSQFHRLTIACIEGSNRVCKGPTRWEPVFEHEGQTLAEMDHEKKVWGIRSYSSQME
ncbi:hypothetical protein PENSTE_c009G10017 [Penicillium steckii]|uniref:Inosine triphosphate pyrophosphatase n=1 Tax=Penicillium steckii TaxID=303698 RepID=A0A1V6T9U8_9EURO|nr:hypothetical protein PENSTE_c009G10017 [Penicillium steckii]